MSEPSIQAQIDAAKAYEALFVTALFEQWAPRVADAAQVRPDHKVLDVACGTGVLAREIQARLDSSGSVTGLDPNPGMLAVANEFAPAVHWQQGVAESLPFSDQQFDAVVSQFGLMFFADSRAALREMLRVLRPEGRLVAAVWDTLASMPAYAAEVDFMQHFAGQRAADALRAPFVLGDRASLATMFRAAGAASTTVTTEAGIARFPSIRVMVEADLRGWLPVMGVFLTEDQIGRILEEAERTLAPYVGADGTVSFAVSAHIATATKS
jgi:SAM-dependent methyltransferase